MVALSRLRSLVLPGFALLLAVLLLGLANPAQAERRSLVILHTNDIHANFLPVEASWRDDRPQIGGFLALEAMVRAERAKWQRVLLLDGGDVLTGTPLCDLDVRGGRGAAVYDLMGMAGYDAVTIGNHEFDHGPEVLDQLVRHAARKARVPLVCANLLRNDGTLWAPAAGRVIEKDGLSVGIVGLVTEDLPGLLHGEALKSFRVLPAAEAAQDWIDALPVRPDVLIALTHIGVQGDEALAAAVPDLDVIVGGHSHTRLTEARRVGKTLIVQAGSALTNVGWLRLEVEDGEIVTTDYELRPLLATGLRPNRRMQSMVRNYSERIDREYGEVLGQLTVDWVRRGEGDSNLGSWVADALADALDADFGVMNNGGIRKDLEAGQVTRLDIVEMLPFYNVTATFEVTGAQLLQMLERNARAIARRGRGPLQVGHAEARWRRNGDTIELVDPKVRGVPIDPARTYVGGSVDYIVYSQPERHFGFVPQGRELRGSLLSDVIEEAVRQAGTVGAPRDGRLGEVTGGAR